MRALGRAAVGAAMILGAAGAATATPPFTVNDARSLSTSKLADELLGERLASRVIEVTRHEYDGSLGSTPQYAEFFTQPELPMPVINGICRTDVIMVEYDWFDLDEVNASTPLKIARVAAKSRYKSFPKPPGEPGSDEYRRAQTAACAEMKTALDAFRAPGGGDAQWLAAIHREYSNPASRFKFTCKELAKRSCSNAREALRGLDLRLANDVQLMDCPKERTGNQVDYCYRLTFPYSVEDRLPEIGDYPNLDNPEWIITVFAGIRDGMAPIRIRLLHLEHVPPPFVLH